MILKFGVQRNFEFSLSKDALARELNAEPKVIDTGMSRLVDEGFILRIRAGVGGKPPIYRLTERGEHLAATVFNPTSAGA
jgi:DNA-binding HxlR family transcriptional regulator